jgi:hypothetical protein
VSASLIAFYATAATLTPLFFIALVFQANAFGERLGFLGGIGALVAVVLLLVSEILSLESLAANHSTRNRVTFDAVAVYLGALFVAFPLIDRVFDGIIGGPPSPGQAAEHEQALQRLRRVARFTLASSAPAAAFWIAKRG